MDKWKPDTRKADITWPEAAQRPTVVAATGSFPYDIDNLRRAAPADYIWLIKPPLPSEARVDLVIVGAIAWDAEFLLQALHQGHAATRVLPQDGFLDLIHFGHDWWAQQPPTKLDRATGQQDGIRAAQALVHEWKGLSFKWPETSAAGTRSDRAWSAHLNEVSALRDRGYQVIGKTDEQRWEALRRCVDELGLQSVAYFIAYLVRTRRDRVRTDVVARWESDLARLREHYHVESLSFHWPEA